MGFSAKSSRLIQEDRFSTKKLYGSRRNFMKEPLFNRIDQIGIVVYNVDKYVKYYEKFFGKDVFQIFEGESIRIFEDGREEKTFCR